MPDVASLGLQVDSSKVRDATLELKQMVPAATAAERAAERWGTTVDGAGKSADMFSKRVQATIRSLEFESAQLTRTAAEQAKYAALRRAGVSASSAEGQAIAASVAALQAQKAAINGVAASTGVAATAATAAASAFRTLWLVLGPLAIVLFAVQQATKAWDAGMKAGDLGEQADQVNLTTDALQAYRFAAVQNGVEVAQLDQAMIRLTATMGQAAQGGKDQIETFQKLGVKLLDAKGQLRATADVLPEVARGLLAMGSGTERNAMLTEMFGKSGARVVTMLQDWAQGTDANINKARALGGILEADVINQWDKVKDSLARAGAAADVTFAKLGAPIATWALEKVAALLESINANLARLKQEAATITVRTAQNDASEIQGQIDAQRGLLAINPNNQMAISSIKGLEARLAAAQNAAAAAARNAQQGAVQMGGAPSSNVSNVLPTITPGSVGVADPRAKASGGATDPFKTAMESSRDYIAAKKAEQAALGQTAFEAARLKHETELLNKATSEGKPITATQTEALKQQAVAMAQADAAFAGAKFMDDLTTKAQEFIAQQEIERDTLYMSTEAAMAYRLEHEALNRAKAEGIDLSPAYIDQIKQVAAAQAQAAEQTRKAKEWADFEKDTFKGFFSDLNQGLREGKNVWESFGNAATNALGKISDKLMDMALNSLWDAAFPKGGGGFLSSILGGIFSGAAGGLGGGSGITFANGAAFRAGNVIPFARGGIVGGPTLFPMANGMGLMGEAGPEAVMPLRRASNGRLGVEMNGGSNGGGRIDIYVHENTNLLRLEIDNRADARIVRATPQLMSSTLDRVPSKMAQHHRDDDGGDHRLG